MVTWCWSSEICWLHPDQIVHPIEHFIQHHCFNTWLAQPNIKEANPRKSRGSRAVHWGGCGKFGAQVTLQIGLPDLFSGFPWHQQPLSPPSLSSPRLLAELVISWNMITAALGLGNHKEQKQLFPARERVHLPNEWFWKLASFAETRFSTI